MSVESFYDILGVTENASQDEIKKAYKKEGKEIKRIKIGIFTLN